MREIVRVKNSYAGGLQPFQIGIDLFVNEDFAEAVTAFHQAIILKPDFAFSHYYLGRSLKRIEKYREAVAAFEQAIRLNPHHAPSYAYLGDVFLRENKFVEAEEYFRRALYLRFDNLTALSGLVKLTKNINGDLNEIAELLKVAYFRGGKNPILLMELFSFQPPETELCLRIAEEQIAQKYYHRAVFSYRLAWRGKPEDQSIQTKIDETLKSI